MKKYKLHPLFIIYLIFLVIIGQFTSILIYFLVVFLHELTHSVVAKKLGYKLDKLLIMPYGVCLNYKTNYFTPQDEILIAISAPLVNLLLSVVCFALWWIYPITFLYTQRFCYANLILFTFNILPCFPLDGGRVLAGILTKKFERKLAIKITVLFNILFCIILILTFIFGIFFNVLNINLLIISLFLFVGILEPNNSSSYNYLSAKCINSSDFLKSKQIKFTLINSSEKIYKIIAKMSKYKFNVFYVIFPNERIKILTEITIKKLALKYDSTFSLDEIPEMFI